MAASLLSGTAEGAGSPVDFAREVRPILMEHCFPCHGPNDESRKAGLRLVEFESATAELESGFAAIVPGSRDRSEMWQRITDPEDPMPPAKERNELSAEQVELLGRWIEEGANYAPHWAYIAPVATAVPSRVDADWPVTDIDHFILERLQHEGLQPAADADQLTLFRRLNYDVTGLPPSTEALDAFLADDGEDAYSRAVNRLLASPHFGERLASAWLDLVRYADTVGYHGDQEHRVWPYRDWVIAAFNSNMPFDRFTIEQLAGDLLEDPDQEQLIATCYNRLIQTSHEGGLQLKEYRSIYMADRIRNVSEVWMGATLGCAQCHDHKYDPYTMRDFYSFGAFFADIDDEEHIRDPYGGLNTTPTRRSPEMRVMTDERRIREQQIASEIEQSQQLIEIAIKELEPLQSQWEQDLSQRITSSEKFQTIWVDDVLDTGGTVSGKWEFVREDDITPHSGELYRRQSSDKLVQHYTVSTTSKRITVGEGDTLFAWVYLRPDSLPAAVMLQCNTAGDWEHRAVWGGDEIGYGRREKSAPAYQRMGELPPSGQWTRIEVPFEKIGLKPGTVVSGIAFTQFGGTVYWDDCGFENASAAPAAVVEALTILSGDRTEKQRQAVRSFQADQSQQVSTLRAQQASLEQQHADIEKSLPLTLFTKGLEMAREVRILPRGNWLDESGEIVEPAIPAFLGSLETSHRASRLDLARWLVTVEADGGVGGMTARVFVNRMWALLFGEGLCPSVENFGGRGRLPTHPELLDHLANEFIASGWDIHELFRKLLLSRTYRQSSRVDPLTQELDPENLFFSHQARYRLPAEMVRDTALTVGGLLVDRLGGPGVKPPQPKHYYRHLNFPKRRYKPDMNQQQWRRGVYVHWQRQFLHPMLKNLDAPRREECTALRIQTNTPLASLTLLNDPTFVETARVFGARIVREGGKSDETRINFTVRHVLSRLPDDHERELLHTFTTNARKHFADNEKAAAELASVGMSSVPIDIPITELATWTTVARAIFNTNEFSMRN